MDYFPQELNRKTCMDKMAVMQCNMIKETRDQFYKKIIASTDECNSSIELDFPPRLWHEHRATIANELLERFGKIKIKIVNPCGDVTKSITDMSDFSANVKKIIIEFATND